MTATRDPLVDPTSVAIVGASDDPTSWGHWLARGALRGESRRRVSLVNRRAAQAGRTVLGRTAFAGVDDLPDVDLVAIAVPGPSVLDIARSALGRGARALVVITADVGPGTDDAAREEAEQRLHDLVAAGGARLLGPSCLGIVDTTTELALAWGEFPAGPVAVVSQSGQVGIEIAHLLRQHGSGISRFVSVGNRGVTAVEALEDLVGHRGTRALAAYAESLDDARRLAEVARRLSDAGTPLVLLAPGGSDAGARAAASHTAALATADSVIDAVCRAGGIVRVRTPAELVAAATSLSGGGRAAGPRVGVVSDSGGQGVIAADALVAAGLTVPLLGAQVRESLRGALGSSRAAVGNPVDLAGAGEGDLSAYARAVGLLVESGEVDSVLVTGYLGRYAVDSPALAGAEVAAALAVREAAARHAVPLVVHAMVTGPAPGVDALRSAGTPVLGRIEDAVAGLVALAAERPDPPAHRPTAAPRPGTAVRTGDSGYAVARRLLERPGLAFPPAVVLPASSDQRSLAVEAAAGLGPRVAVKATSLQHKTEHGAVILDLVGGREVADAVDDLRARLGPVEITVESMARPETGIELIVGARRDPVVGPVVMVGAGGVTAEADPDTAVALAPLARTQALALLARLRLAPLLDGWRGAAPLDRESAARWVVAVAQALDSDPDLAEIEVNPLVVTSAGALALDAWATVVPR